MVEELRFWRGKRVGGWWFGMRDQRGIGREGMIGVVV